MKKAISVLAYGTGRPLIECLRITKQAGFQGLEQLRGLDGDVGPRFTSEDVSRIARLARDEGLEISGLSTAIQQPFNLTSEDAAEREMTDQVREESTHGA